MATTINTSQNNAHPQYQSQNQYQYINPTPSQSIQNIKYFLESYKSSKVKEIFSEKFTNSGLYCEDSQIPDSFYRLRKPFDQKQPSLSSFKAKVVLFSNYYSYQLCSQGRISKPTRRRRWGLRAPRPAPGS